MSSNSIELARRKLNTKVSGGSGLMPTQPPYLSLSSYLSIENIKNRSESYLTNFSTSPIFFKKTLDLASKLKS
jgi:hypothetical protein